LSIEQQFTETTNKSDEFLATLSKKGFGSQAEDVDNPPVKKIMFSFEQATEGVSSSVLRSSAYSDSPADKVWKDFVDVLMCGDVRSGG